MNSDVKQTIREALNEWQHAIFDGWNIGKVADPDATITAIDAALTWLDAQGGTP